MGENAHKGNSNPRNSVSDRHMEKMEAELYWAYRICRKIALGHYENFPVGSILIPRKLRKHFFALYAFMRTADDFADLPHRRREERLRLLGQWREQLHSIFIGNNPDEPIFLALQDTVRTFDLPQAPFDLLLDAFEFDARGNVRFETYDDLHWYTARSAEPVGELVLALFGYRDVERIGWSNKICSALQLINFLQDAKEDLINGRCYFPREAYEQFGIADGQAILFSKRSGEFVLFECDRIEEMLKAGTPLIGSVQGRLKWELRAVKAGANEMLTKIRTLQGQTIVERPKLSPFSRLKILRG